MSETPSISRDKSFDCGRLIKVKRHLEVYQPFICREYAR